MKLFLDTDIGTDVDDAIALGVILGSPDLQLVGISTVYGDTALRARLASRLMGLAPTPPRFLVAPGEGATRSGKPVWWPGHEGALHQDLESEQIGADRSGVEELLAAAERFAGELVVLAIGPLTNIAIALDTDPRFERNVSRIVIMGGNVGVDRLPEHNFSSDVDATQRVFESAARIDVAGLDITRQVETSRTDIGVIRETGRFGRTLADEIAQYWAFHGREGNNPHDAILVAYLVHPELFTTVRCSVVVDAAGRSFEEAADDGRVRLLTSMDGEAVLRAIVDRICAVG